MEGGVVTIRFEADTTGIDSSLKNIQENVKKIDIASYNAETNRILAQARKLNAESRKMMSSFKNQHPEIEKNRAAAARINAEFKAQNVELERQKAATSEINAKARLLREENRKNGLITKENTQSTLNWVGAYYLAKNALNLIGDGLKGIASSIKDMLSYTKKWATAIFSLTHPVATLTTLFLKQSGILNKIKQTLSWNSLFNFGKSALEAASDLVEVQNIVDTAFPSMSDEMNKWADNSIQAFGLSEKSAKQYAATLGLMAQSAGLAEKQSYKLGTGLTAVTADLASMYNMDAQTVYEKIRSGVIGGRTMAIAQLGINMNQANLQAYMASKGIGEKYNNLDNATKTAIRYNYVLEQTTKIQGDFVKTQGTWANQTRILAENITALKASVGEFLVTALTPLIRYLNQFIQVLIKGVEKLKEFLVLLGFDIQKAAASGGGSGLEGLADDLSDVGDAADSTASKITKLTDGPFSEMHKVGGDDNSSLQSKLKDLFGASGLLDYTNPYTLKETKELDTWLTRLLSKLDFSGLRKEFLRFIEEIKKWIKDIKDAWDKAWNKNDNGPKWLQSIINMAEQILGFVNDISEAFRNMWEAGYGEEIFSHMLTTATKINDLITKIVKGWRDAWNSPSGKMGYVKKKDSNNPLERKTGAKGINPWGNDKFDFIDPNNDKEFRELTWGEYIASIFYEIQLSVLDAIDAIVDFFKIIDENVNKKKILEGWAKFLKDVKDALDGISEWLRNHPEVAKKLGELITDILSNPGAIFKTVIAIKALTGAFEGLKVVVGGLMLKKLWTSLGGLGAGAAGKAAAGAGGKTLLGQTTATTGVLSSRLIGVAAAELAANPIGRIFGDDEHSWTNAYAKAREQGKGWFESFMIGMKESANNYGGWGGILGDAFTNLGKTWGKEIGIEKQYKELFQDPSKYLNKEEFSASINNFWSSALEQYGTSAAIAKQYEEEMKMTADDLWQHYVETFTKENMPNPRDYLNSEEYYAAVEDFKTKYQELSGEVYDDTELMKQYSQDWSDYAQLCQEGAITNMETRWNGFISSVKSLLDDLGSKLREILGLEKEVQSISTYSGSSGAKWVHNSVGNYANVKFSGKHANGGVWAPNSPAIAVLGDQPYGRGNEYALTETHLDNIADRMASGIMNGFARVSLASAGGGTPNIYVQIGDREIKDLIVTTVNEENYRRF